MARIALLMYGLPEPEMDGASMACWAMAGELRALGHAVTVVSLMDSRHRRPEAPARAALASRGIELQVVRLSESTAPARPPWIRPGLDLLSPFAAAAAEVREALDACRPDALLLYHVEAVAAVSSYQRAVSRLVVLGDPPHLPDYYRWCATPPALSWSYLRRTLGLAYRAYWVPRLLQQAVRDAVYVGELAGHHAAWFQQHGIPACRHVRMPIADPLAGAVTSPPRSPGAPLRILMIGTMNATSTSAGLRALARIVLPRLDQALGVDRFTLRLVGRGTLPADTAAALSHPSVVICGGLERAEDEWRAADMLLIATPIPLGVRTRAIVGFAYGMCIVAHAANAQGLPEMRHEVNALLAHDEAGMADAVIRLAHDEPLRRRLAAEARRTYDAYFLPSRAMAPLVQVLDRVTGAHDGQTAPQERTEIAAHEP